MGEGCGSWFPPQQFDCQPQQFGFPLLPGQWTNFPSYPKAGTDMFSTNVALPMCQFSEIDHSRVDQVNEPCAWFYCLPRFWQAFIPALNPVAREKLHTVNDVNCKYVSMPNNSTQCDKKRFLVFDQSGDRTKLVLSSGFGPTLKRFTYWNPKQNPPNTLIREDNLTNEDPIANLGEKIITPDDAGRDLGSDLQSEIHEDTEELNALLYSDDDSDCSVEDEVTSTGRSPSKMTATPGRPAWLEHTDEEVRSSNGFTGKRKLLDEEYMNCRSLVDTTISLEPAGSYACEDDVESRCEFGLHNVSLEMGSELGIRRMKKEKIHEALSILEKIIPGGKGKNTMEILDEAIVYLTSLNVKAKALGLDTP